MTIDFIDTTEEDSPKSCKRLATTIQSGPPGRKSRTVQDDTPPATNKNSPTKSENAEQAVPETPEDLLAGHRNASPTGSQTPNDLDETSPLGKLVIASQSRPRSPEHRTQTAFLSAGIPDILGDETLIYQKRDEDSDRDDLDETEVRQLHEAIESCFKGKLQLPPQLVEDTIWTVEEKGTEVFQLLRPLLG